MEFLVHYIVGTKYVALYLVIGVILSKLLKIEGANPETVFFIEKYLGGSNRFNLFIVIFCLPMLMYHFTTGGNSK
jgi:hypothetical protein